MQKKTLIQTVDKSYRPPRAKNKLRERLRARVLAPPEIEQLHRSFSKQMARDRRKLEHIIEVMLASHPGCTSAQLSRHERHALITRNMAADIKEAAAQEGVYILTDQVKDEVVAHLERNGL